MKNPLEKHNKPRATEEEIKSLKENKTWKSVNPPQEKKIVGCKWTFKVKYNCNGEIEKHEAHLLAKCFSQKYGDDYNETFANVVLYTAIRALLTAAVHKKNKTLIILILISHSFTAN